MAAHTLTLTHRDTHMHRGSYPAAFRELPEAFIDHREKVAINLTKA